MNNLYLSKSIYCKCLQCMKMYWLNKFKPEEAVPVDNETVLKNGNKVGELAKGLFGKYNDVEFNKDITVMIDKTNELLKDKPNIITEASFNFNNNFCSVDILKNDIDGVEIYEVKSSTKINPVYIEDASYQNYILTNLGYNVKKVSIVYINEDYVRGENLDLNQLFIIKEITDEAKSKLDDIRNIIVYFNEFMKEHPEGKEPDINIGFQCSKPYACAYWDYCTRNLPKPNVFDIKGGIHKETQFQKYNEGKISFEDLINEKMNPKFIEQVDFELNNREPKIDKKAIKELLDSLKYPLYFLDYETYQTPIPEIIGTTPYQQLPFQYSLHIIREPGAKLEHKEFLAEIDDNDCIRHFAEQLIHDIPDDGSVIIYNNSFEPARNREIYRMYPEYFDGLDRINNNMVDFMVPFRNRNYYTREMQGSYSIKYVLPALYPNDPELDYHNLPVVHNGGEASSSFISLQGMSKEEQERVRHGLLVYCELDTYAMVKVWEKFKEVIAERMKVGVYYFGYWKNDYMPMWIGE